MSMLSNKHHILTNYQPTDRLINIPWHNYYWWEFWFIIRVINDFIIDLIAVKLEVIYLLTPNLYMKLKYWLLSKHHLTVRLMIFKVKFEYSI